MYHATIVHGSLKHMNTCYELPFLHVNKLKNTNDDVKTDYLDEMM